MINEIDTTLRDTMQDLELFINIRNGEALRALEVERFGFANVDLKAMVRDREDRELAKLNSDFIGVNVGLPIFGNRQTQPNYNPTPVRRRKANIFDRSQLGKSPLP